MHNIDDVNVHLNLMRGSYKIFVATICHANKEEVFPLMYKIMNEYILHL